MASNLLIRPNDFMVKIDLKDAYLTVPIRRDHRRFLRFRRGDDLFEFTCLPFGLCSAPRAFTKLLKPALAWLRERGIRPIVYLDDFIVLNQSRTSLLEDLETVIGLLDNLGFLINWVKSVVEPCQIMGYLGLMIDSVAGTIAQENLLGR